jgi:hypothetical protein
MLIGPALGGRILRQWIEHESRFAIPVETSISGYAKSLMHSMTTATWPKSRHLVHMVSNTCSASEVTSLLRRYFGHLVNAPPPDRLNKRIDLISLFDLPTICDRRQSRPKSNPPLQKSSAIPASPRPSDPRLMYSPVLAPTTRLKALLNAASDS